ncbi:hypothetical protein ACJMK2_016092 [Sinanodonta woodiana]|uniref:C-type lectin domain-containing protein n=1 Tax=Sinanodonta woodiana TaxID=1069815 RepID=A0ABD3UVB6_SINWO
MYNVLILVSNLLGFISGTHYFHEIISNTGKTTDVWVGLTEPVNGTRQWVDCEEWENGHWNNFANDTYSYYHQCYKLRSSSDWKWESTLCWEKYQFVCERNETGNCTFRDYLLSYDTVLFELNEMECSLLCMSSSDCWAVMWNDTSNTCHHIIVNNGSSLSKFKVKICYTGETHTASAPCLEDNSLIPNNSCILPTPSSTVAIDSLSSTYVHPSVSISALEPYQVIYINDIRVAVDGCDFVSLVETTKICSTATPINVEFSSLTSDPSDMFQTMITIASLSPTTSTVDMASTESYVDPCMCKELITVFSQYLTCSKFKHHASSTVPDVKGLVSNLTVNKKSTGSFQRLLTSAKDNRPEAVAVGTIGIIFIVMVFISILTPDVIGLAIFIKKMYSKHKTKGKEQKRIRKYEQMMTRRLNGPFPDFYPAYSSDVN